MGQIRKRGKVYWIRYYRDGQRFEESARTENQDVARRLMKLREGDVAEGVPIGPKIGRLLFDDAIMDVVRDYTTNGKASVDEVQRRIEKHLLSYFGGRRMADLTTTDIRKYIAKRQADDTVTRRAYTVTRPDGTVRTVPEHRRSIANVSSGEINRELTIVKRAFTLAPQAGTLMVRPHIPLLKERNARRESSSAISPNRSGRTCRKPSARSCVCLRHRLARAQRGPDAYQGASGSQGRHGAARTEHDEERRRAAVPDHG